MDRLTVSSAARPVSHGWPDVRRATDCWVLFRRINWVCQNVRRATSHYGAKRIRRFFFALFVALSSSLAVAETISYSIYSLPIFGGEPQLIAEAKRVYSHEEIRSTSVPARGVTNWTRTLAIANGFEIGASVYREPKTDGFGLWIHKDGQGFSWEWFTREKDQVFRKLQGPGRLKVRFAHFGQMEELAEVEFMDDVVMRLNTRKFTTLIPFLNQETDHLVVRKGSVLWLAP